MSKFQKNRPMPAVETNPEVAEKAEGILQSAPDAVVKQPVIIAPQTQNVNQLKPDKMFSVMLSAEDSETLEKLSKLEDRSMRKIARRLLSTALHAEIAKYPHK